ncbi:MAG: hypothetical protein WC763_02365 [Candidatus Paceibacterota bacterium]|jgi:serine/threonine protein kinase
MFFESSPIEDAVELAMKEKFTAQEILENPTGFFIEKKPGPEELAEATHMHEAIISNPGLFVGSGNEGFVFDYPSDKQPMCAKHIWEHLSVEMKGKQFGQLPPRLQELRKIQEHFEKVQEGRKAAQKRGNIEFAASNSPEVEASLQIAAHMLLEQAGFVGSVPDIKSLIRIESKGEGESDGAPFMYREVADVFSMEKVPGKSIQDFILGYEEHLDALEALDPDDFKATLLSMIGVLHDNDFTHQDMTNRNVMVNFSTGKPVIIDFGKACYRGGSFSKEEEVGHIEAVCRTLAAFKRDPENTRKELKRQLKLVF